MSVYSDCASMEGSFIFEKQSAQNQGNAPSTFRLFQNHPNPFNPTTRLQYDLPEDAYVSLKIYDLVGREVAILVSGHQKAGRYAAEFDASRLASGVYLYKLDAGNFSAVKKMIVAK